MLRCDLARSRLHRKSFCRETVHLALLVGDRYRCFSSVCDSSSATRNGVSSSCGSTPLYKGWPVSAPRAKSTLEGALANGERQVMVKLTGWNDEREFALKIWG